MKIKDTFKKDEIDNQKAQEATGPFEDRTTYTASDIAEDATTATTNDAGEDTTGSTVEDISDNNATEPDKETLDVTAENNLEYVHLTRKEKRATRKARYKEYTRTMSGREKFSYIVSYYKWHFIIPVVATFLILYIAKTIHYNNRPIALSYAVLNVDSTSITRDFYDDYSEFFGYSEEYRYESNATMAIDYEKFMENREFFISNNSSDYYMLSKQCEFGDFDVIITDLNGLLFCANEDITKRLNQTFDVNTCKKLEPYTYSLELSEGYSEGYAIDISDTEFAKNLNLPYEEVYLAFPAATKQNKQNSLNLLTYIYGISFSE